MPHVAKLGVHAVVHNMLRDCRQKLPAARHQQLKVSEGSQGAFGLLDSLQVLPELLIHVCSQVVNLPGGYLFGYVLGYLFGYLFSNLTGGCFDGGKAYGFAR